MIIEVEPCVLAGRIAAPPSKSMAHRYLIAAALSGHECTLSGVDGCEDILATIDCLQALGAQIELRGGSEESGERAGSLSVRLASMKISAVLTVSRFIKRLIR